MPPGPKCHQEDLPPKTEIRDHKAEPENRLWVLAGRALQPQSSDLRALWSLRTGDRALGRADVTWGGRPQGAQEGLTNLPRAPFLLLRWAVTAPFLSQDRGPGLVQVQGMYFSVGVAKELPGSQLACSCARRVQDAVITMQEGFHVQPCVS